MIRSQETLNWLDDSQDELEIFRAKEEAAQQYFFAYPFVQTLPAEQPSIGQDHGRSTNSAIM
jgi:hypothetical protein